MKTAYGNEAYAKKAAAFQQQALQVNPPAIPFKKKTKSKEESAKDDLDETKRKTIKIRIDPEDEESDQLDIKVAVFEEDDAVDLTEDIPRRSHSRRPHYSDEPEEQDGDW